MEEYSHYHESGSQQTSIDEIIQCEKLTKRYPIGNNLVVDQLDLTVHHGEIFGLLVDPNSAGKTTTVGMLTSLVLTSSLGLFLGTRISPRNIGIMFGFIVLPITFIGGTYYPWETLSSINIAGFPWLQAAVCINPLIYVTEGFCAALTTAPHMALYVIYPVLIGLSDLFLWLGTKGFYNRVLS